LCKKGSSYHLTFKNCEYVTIIEKNLKVQTVKLFRPFMPQEDPKKIRGKK